MPTVVKVALIVAVLLAMFYLGFLFSTGGPGALVIPGPQSSAHAGGHGSGSSPSLCSGIDFSWSSVNDVTA